MQPKQKCHQILSTTLMCHHLSDSTMHTIIQKVLTLVRLPIWMHTWFCGARVLPRVGRGGLPVQREALGLLLAVRRLYGSMRHAPVPSAVHLPGRVGGGACARAQCACWYAYCNIAAAGPGCACALMRTHAATGIQPEQVHADRPCISRELYRIAGYFSLATPAAVVLSLETRDGILLSKLNGHPISIWNPRTCTGLHAHAKGGLQRRGRPGARRDAYGLRAGDPGHPRLPLGMYSGGAGFLGLGRRAGLRRWILCAMGAMAIATAHAESKAAVHACTWPGFSPPSWFVQLRRPRSSRLPRRMHYEAFVGSCRQGAYLRSR